MRNPGLKKSHEVAHYHDGSTITVSCSSLLTFDDTRIILPSLLLSHQNFNIGRMNHSLLRSVIFCNIFFVERICYDVHTSDEYKLCEIK